MYFVVVSLGFVRIKQTNYNVFVSIRSAHYSHASCFSPVWSLYAKLS